jgi:hypothetical protein
MASPMHVPGYGVECIVPLNAASAEPEKPQIKNKSTNVPRNRLGTKELWSGTSLWILRSKKNDSNSRWDCWIGIYLQRIFIRTKEQWLNEGVFAQKYFGDNSASNLGFGIYLQGRNSSRRVFTERGFCGSRCRTTAGISKRRAPTPTSK